MTPERNRELKSPVRCAAYTRKSTDEGLEQEFNSLDAQRESAEAYVASQQHEGWVCLVDHYDDGGFTGGNMERPGVRHLMADIEAGKIDCVIVYKVDRLSRSLMDFARMMETFEKYHVSFVSVTQQFNTATPMGRLILNVLLSFAQFERELIAERTRDKIAATRRKGKWSGGMPLLGYDVVDTKLVVKPDEAERVREIFQLYVEHESLLKVVKELNRRGWTTKSWTTRKGTTRGGASFTKTRLHALLTNVAYIGKVRYKDEVHDGEHEGIVATSDFQRVQKLLSTNGHAGGTRNKYGALLRGLLRCSACDCAMSHSYTQRGNRRYRYYVCTNAQKTGWDSCPAPSVPAGEIERFVIDHIKAIGRDPGVVAATLAEAQRQAEEAIKRLEAESSRLRRQLRRDERGIHDLTTQGALSGAAVVALADLQEQASSAERRLTEIQHEVAALQGELVSEDEVTEALADFEPVWESLAPREQAQVIQLLIEAVEFDGEEGDVSITFRPTGIKALGDRDEEAAA